MCFNIYDGQTSITIGEMGKYIVACDCRYGTMVKQKGYKDYLTNEPLLHAYIFVIMINAGIFCVKY